MVTSATLVHNDNCDRWLQYNDQEHPAVLQLGGSSPADLRGAVAKAKPYNYDEINLNCGCPSDKVAGKGCFGAALMREPQLVADLCSGMAEEFGGPVTGGTGTGGQRPDLALEGQKRGVGGRLGPNPLLTCEQAHVGRAGRGGGEG